MAAEVRAAVLGSPVSHSLSPVLHRAAYARLGLSDWSYDAVECDAVRLPALLAAARGDPSFGGYSLTMPLKVAALPLLDDVEPLARRVAAVNTVVPVDTGLVGANTDVPGMVAALLEAGVDAVARPVVVGGGGSAQAALAALEVLGAGQVTVVLRDPAKAGPLHAVADRVGVEAVVAPWGAAPLRHADLVVATVPAGAADGLAERLQQTGWPAGAALFDLLYDPWPTPLAQCATAAGATVVGGLDLLVHQAVGQVELMTKRQVPVHVLRAAGEAALAARAAKH